MAAPAGLGSDDRAAQLNQLAARIAEVGPGGAARGVVGSTRGSVSGRGRPAVIGADSEKTPPVAGGHPEDAPGDPTAVAKGICLRLLTGAPRSRAMLADALRRKEIPDDVATAVLDRLTEVGLVDDESYAETFVTAKHRDRGLGRTALRTELRRKGLSDDVVARAVTAIDDEAERDRARALISHRVDAAMAAGPIAARRRLVALLARRGYSPSVAIQVVDEALTAYGVDPADPADPADSGG